LPVDLYPEIELPYVVVYTTYPGASASDIESNVTKTLENTLNSVSNLKEITSRSSDATSVIFMNFNYGRTSMRHPTISGAPSVSWNDTFRPIVEKPTIMKFNSSMMPIAYYTITAKESYQGLEKILDEKIVNPLNRIEGVGSVSLSGVRDVKYILMSTPGKWRHIILL